MITFCVSLVLLVVGALVYSRYVEKVFGVEPERRTPCYSQEDGVDYVPMPTWKVFLIQFLNIAGTGPIFGAIMGILFGPAAYLWIVFGCLFAGGVHDYLSGMISLRKGGVSLPEMVGDELGSVARIVMRVFSVTLLVLVGTVFVVTPADLLGNMTAGSFATPLFWTCIIFVYYLLATLLPISSLIGRVYPVFGIALLVMALGVGVNIVVNPGWMPEVTDGLSSHHPGGLPVFPMLCITIACGAISGFHGTQNPLMARCMTNERDGRRVFYWAMVAEGIVALIWAAAAIKFFGDYGTLGNAGTPGVIVNKICSSWMGVVGAALAVLGVVAAPVTSGDTAFRSARLIVSDMFKMKKGGACNRVLVTLPMFAVSVLLMFLDFNVLWRYFAWCNQTLATITLWASAVWLVRQSRSCWMAVLPAVFMTVVCVCYIIVAPEGFLLPYWIGLVSGIVVSIVVSILFFVWKSKR